VMSPKRLVTPRRRMAREPDTIPKHDESLARGARRRLSYDSGIE
jgi:hypothetical protein